MFSRLLLTNLEKMGEAVCRSNFTDNYNKKEKARKKKVPPDRRHRTRLPPDRKAKASRTKLQPDRSPKASTIWLLPDR